MLYTFEVFRDDKEIEDMHGLKNLKTEANSFLKIQKICSTVNRLSDLLIKQPEEQEVRSSR